jgi:hypothetical protein
MIRSAARIVVLDSQTKLASALLPMSQLVMHHVKLLPSANLIMDGNGVNATLILQIVVIPQIVVMI